MCEEVAHRRARRSGRLVEVADPFLRSDEDGEGRDGLGHRGEQDSVAGIPAGRNHRIGARHARRREGHVPVVDLEKCLHARRY